MGTSTIDRMGSPRWLRWFRAAGGASSPSPSGQSRQLEELESELALLREENARLKVQQERPRDRPVNERVRELLPLRREEGSDSDEPWELLTDCLMLRDGLVNACREIEHGMRETRRRLDAILPEGGRGSEDAGAVMSDELESVA